MSIVVLVMIILAYLLGSISSAVLICRVCHLPDPRTQGSKNPGATNVLRIAGKKYAALVMIGDILKGTIPVLIAKALGAKVGKSPAPEIGWQKISYVDDPATREWFGEDPTDTVVHWHYESFEIPSGAKLLASTEACPNQAFTIGKALAMQFHIEMDAEKAQAWADDEDPKWASARAEYSTVQDRTAILAGINPHLAQHQATADHIYRTWLNTSIL